VLTADGAYLALAGTVTIGEHKRLAVVDRANPDLVGWQRYHAAGIESATSGRARVGAGHGQQTSKPKET